jgi:hypothetical protein
VILFTLLLACSIQAGVAQDRIDLEVEGTAVIGNRELPKVLYVVPWKRSELAEDDPGVRGLVDEALAPLDREVFVREVEYYYEVVNPAGADSVSQ